MAIFSSPSSVTVVSKCTVLPEHKSNLGDLKLSVSDLPMLSIHYIQKGCLFTRPPLPITDLIARLKRGLSQALTKFPPLAGRFYTDNAGRVFIACNDFGADFVYAKAGPIFVCDVLCPADVPLVVKEFFAFDRTVSYDGHFRPILAVQVTELADGVFIGCTANHAVVDGTSFWNFFNSFAEVCRGLKRITRSPDFRRDSVLMSPAVLELPAGGPKVTFSADAPLRERIFSFTRKSIAELKHRANNRKWLVGGNGDGRLSAVDIEVMGKQSNDRWKAADGKTAVIQQPNGGDTETDLFEVSSFQSLCALLWRAVTRARKLPSSKATTFRMAVNCRQRMEPKLDPFYFGNAIQSIPTVATAGEVLGGGLRWCAGELNRSVKAHDNATVRRFVKEWESSPRCFPLGNFDGSMITMGSSPRFPMYDNDFGWGRPVAVRSGRANKFDGKISAFPGREGSGSVDLEVCLSPDTMAGLEMDLEFMRYVTTI